MTESSKKDINIISAAREVISKEISALNSVSENLGEELGKAVDMILENGGRLIITGIGKSGLVGRKIAATMASTGTPAYFLHPAEGFHGDLGLILPNDIVMLISYSGETEEILNLLPSLKRINVRLISITAGSECTLARKADIALLIGKFDEADPMNLVPTSSTTATMALGDALSVALLMKRGFEKGDFAQFHPGGSLGRKLLLKLEDIAFVGVNNPKVKQDGKFRDAQFILMKKHLGAVCVIDDNGLLVGIVTDGDVRRLLERHEDVKISEIMELPIESVMTANPKSLHIDTLAIEGLKFMQKHLISQLPLVDDSGKAAGLVRLLDLTRTGLRSEEK